MNRRLFLKNMGWASSLMALPNLFCDVVTAANHKPATPIRIKGKVQSNGKGLPHVAVTDGLSVVTTDAAGVFTLVSSTARDYVYISMPSGYTIPMNATGTARFYQRIQANAQGEMSTVFNLTALPVSDMHHQFLALGDIQTQDKFETARFLNETVPDLKDTIKRGNLTTAFGVSVGDIMFDDLSLYPDYEQGVQQTQLPFFQVVGNHDLDFDGFTDESSTRTFRQRFGPTYYSFNRGAVHYVVLENVLWHKTGYIGYVADEQLAWLAQDLALVEKGKPVVLFWHIPAQPTQNFRYGDTKLSASSSVTNREAVYQLLAPYQVHIISGHTHEHEHVFASNTHEHVLATVCGAWWSGDLCNDGSPNGYAVFEVKEESISWRYKATKGADDDQMRVYKHGSDPKAPTEIVANIWDADPKWEVSWYEDGIRVGGMAQRQGIDPLAEAEQRGNAKPLRRTWVEPIPTQHMFYAPAAKTAKEIIVEAKDRFGRVYRTKLL